MRTLTETEALGWCRRERLTLGDDNLPIWPLATSKRRFPVMKDATRLTWFANFVERSLRPRDYCLLWISITGVWRDSENWHLYYRLRQTYGDWRLLEEAPGHLFLEYESADLATFLEVGLLGSWDMYVLTGTQGYISAFISHDEWIEFCSDDEALLKEIEEGLKPAGLLPFGDA